MAACGLGVQLLEAAVKAGGSRHVVAATASAIWRLAVQPDRAAEPQAWPMPDVGSLEEAMSSVRLLYGDVGISDAVGRLRAEEHDGSKSAGGPILKRSRLESGRILSGSPISGPESLSRNIGYMQLG